ncbi:unnamed protein product [Cylicocyclus nassatus]|uniref:Glycosyltransferase family 92 protein n=1 Tax=Cylicocyclus nassatus TaxID=53992 RepID=A0AA36MAY3_CYLNA|nr:unnamed protein product [Cylicocyclus nassatus]
MLSTYTSGSCNCDEIEGDGIRMIVDDYVRTGDAEVIVLHGPFEKRVRFRQTMQLQECLNRARGHPRWVAFVDLDERGVRDHKVGGIDVRLLLIMQNEKFPAKYKDANQVADWMPTRRFRNASRIAGPWKCIIDPEKVSVPGLLSKASKQPRTY